ncbi:hypothetical protein [Mesorhizobium sp. B2-8-9]|uniref:hypothetical protein n=1 Tax=Mesorhizobium sp. B2-8-9 TaxID=2589899 RepID=UPI001127FB20|nr:hypothetical protein [Mesorhizobium sp. B2-8-9]TPI80427.1 hypothetical protein FJ423_12090 [Mesorhizobium sp. B2-8-9]
MDHIVTLDSRQEAALQAAADRFVRQHGGNTMKALKEQMLLNAHLQESLDALSGEMKYPRQSRR